MKIALVSLPFWPTYSPPLGPAYISSVLQKLGHDVCIFDKNIELANKYLNSEINPWDDELINSNFNKTYFNEVTFPLLKSDLTSFVKTLLANDYDAIGFSVTELSYYVTQYLSMLLKKLAPDLLIFWGGPEVTAKKEAILLDVKSGTFDVGFEAEAEDTVVEFFEAYSLDKPIHNILGLICNHPENVKNLKKKRGPIDYKSLPFPDFSDYSLNLYKNNQLPIMMSRGCVATCSFCTEFLTWKSYRVRTAIDVVEEIKRNILTYGVKDFIFCDSLINGNHEQLHALCDGLKDVECTWTAFCRVDTKLTTELLFKMYKAGCRELLIGFESDSQKVLNLMNKGTKVEQNQRVLDDAFSAGIKVHGLFLIGFPGELDSDFQKTLRFIHLNRHKFYVISIGNSLTLPPQSVIGIIPKKFNILTDDKGFPLLDSNGEWTSSDNSITPLIRKKRMKKLRNYLESMNLKWGPKKYIERSLTGRIYYRALYFFISSYFRLKFIRG